MKLNKHGRIKPRKIDRVKQAWSGSNLRKNYGLSSDNSWKASMTHRAQNTQISD